MAKKSPSLEELLTGQQPMTTIPGIGMYTTNYGIADNKMQLPNISVPTSTFESPEKQDQSDQIQALLLQKQLDYKPGPLQKTLEQITQESEARARGAENVRQIPPEDRKALFDRWDQGKDMSILDKSRSSPEWFKLRAEYARTHKGDLDAKLRTYKQSMAEAATLSSKDVLEKRVSIQTAREALGRLADTLGRMKEDPKQWPLLAQAIRIVKLKGEGDPELSRFSTDISEAAIQSAAAFSSGSGLTDQRVKTLENSISRGLNKSQILAQIGEANTFLNNRDEAYNDFGASFAPKPVAPPAPPDDTLTTEAEKFNVPEGEMLVYDQDGNPRTIPKDADSENLKKYGLSKTKPFLNK